jgi:predicted RNA-binding Zn-ribbon protein involved in translation (DUF1610 family)
MPRRPKYSRELLASLAADSRSVSEVLRKLGLRFTGGGHAYLKRRLVRDGIDTSHFLGLRANSGGSRRGPKPRAPDEVLTAQDPSAPPVKAALLRRLLRDLGRPYQCEACRLPDSWNGVPLVLEVDHVNGLHHDYRVENLRLLCPNCHSQTVNYCRRNRASAEVVERQTRGA